MNENPQNNSLSQNVDIEHKIGSNGENTSKLSQISWGYKFSNQHGCGSKLNLGGHDFWRF